MRPLPQHMGVSISSAATLELFFGSFSEDARGADAAADAALLLLVLLLAAAAAAATPDCLKMMLNMVPQDTKPKSSNQEADARFSAQLFKCYIAR